MCKLTEERRFVVSVLSKAQRMLIDECTAGIAFVLFIVVTLGRSRVPCPTVPSGQTVLNGVGVNACKF